MNDRRRVVDGAKPSYLVFSCTSGTRTNPPGARFRQTANLREMDTLGKGKVRGVFTEEEAQNRQNPRRSRWAPVPCESSATPSRVLHYGSNCPRNARCGK